MTSVTVFFLVVGVSYATSLLMRFILWLDTPGKG